VTNRPVSFNDPTGHRPKEDDPKPPFITVTDEDGLCLNFPKVSACSGGTSDDWFYKHVRKQRASEFRDLLGSVSKGNGLISFGDDTRGYWTGSGSNPKLGFGLDAVTQLMEDASRDDLTWGDRLARAGISGVEGMTIGQISTSVATKASAAVVEPSAAVAVETGQLWVVPVAVVATWTVTYFAVHNALDYVSKKINETAFPNLGY